MRPLLLDLFCGAGGASRGYHDAGFDVVGVDLAAQPRYPYAFVRADALEYLAGLGSDPSIDGRRVDAIHASPPCQRYSTMTARHGSGQVATHPDLVAPTRIRIHATGRPYVMENVPRAPLLEPVTLCGSMFELGLRPDRPVYLKRHRLFESNVWLWPPGPCAHRGTALAVYGHAGGSSTRDPGAAFGTTEEWSRAMGVDWMTGAELAEAIPPAYTRWIGATLLAALGRTT